MIRLDFAAVCPRGPSIFEVSQMLDRRAALSLLLPQPRDRQGAKCSAFSREMGTGKVCSLISVSFVVPEHMSKYRVLVFFISIYSVYLVYIHNFIIILSRVYNEPIQRPAPSWLVSLIGRALHR